jgi:hypothetical protein
VTIDTDAAVRVMRDANPVPDPVSLANAMENSAVFLDVTKEATQMDTYEETNKKPDEGRSLGGGLRIAVAAFVAVLLVGAAAIFLLQANDDQSAAAPEDVTTEFIEAQNAGDGAAVFALFAPGATVEDAAVVDTSELVKRLDWYSALEWDWTPTECTESTAGAATTVTCSYTHENAWTRALGVGPYDAGEATYVVESGLITSFVYEFDDLGFSQEAWDPFLYWVLRHHPDDLTTIVPDYCCTPAWTPGAVVLWAEFTEEFVAEQAG